MAKDPTLQNALDQHQSLLFRLPRELRDEIYHYYSQANGYYYDSTSGTLRMDGGESIDLSLQYTCKRTAAEMQGIALGINKITFRTMVDLPRPSDQLMKSQVFDHYIRKRRRTILSRMVEWTYPLVTDETMRQLCERHPANLAVKKMRELHREGDSDGPLAGGHLWGDNGGFDTVDYDEYSAEAIVILRDLLDIISTDPGFWHMTASDFDVNARRAFFVATEHWATRWDKFEDYLTEHIPVYTSKAEQQQVLQWQPDSWFIPTDDDLEALEELITKADPIHGPYFDHMLGEGFADAIKGVIEGNIPARFDADMGKIWDIDQLLRDQDGDWPEDLDDVFELRNLEEPPEGWCAAHEERFGVWKHRDSVRLDWTEYMEGVEMLFEAE
ncbi:hypothetical protein J4E83_006856 [Alternaria metachromatica]|uniref:uncharacterized protein n=1 Tax=Alternaria metachromatica TaxID=283354 RepID=UPI0020C3F9DB|nr:uncharacterized protein J4E83_006856 [Alternaria metachromatica]KAI4615132.1 hypothetical protein J4E83_006856 [Alternaria metachromatica]